MIIDAQSNVRYAQLSVRNEFQEFRKEVLTIMNEELMKKDEEIQKKNNEIEMMRETLTIIKLQKRFDDAIELLECNRIMKNRMLPKLRTLVSRSLHKISAFFHPGQELTDMEALGEVSAIRDINRIDIGDFEYHGEWITITAELTTWGPKEALVKARIVGSTNIIYTEDVNTDLASAETVTGVIAAAKNEIDHRKKVVTIISEIENGNTEAITE
nr:MAG TPA: hypothetical protein [Caudoviricetes sp.]